MRAGVFLVVVLSLSAPWAEAQVPQAGDGPGLLVERLEDALHRGSADAFKALFASTLPQEDVEGHAAATIYEGVTRAAVYERDRGPLPGSPRDEGYRLIIEVFLQRDREASIFTYRLDVRRLAGTDPPTFEEPGWRVHEMVRLTSVEGLYRLHLTPTRQFAVTNLVVNAEDLVLTIPSGHAFVSETPAGITGLVLLGHGTMRFSPKPAAERGQVRLFCGREVLDTSFTAAFIRINPSDLEERLTMRALKPVPVDRRVFRRAEAVFDEEVGKSFSLDLRELSRETWSLMPGFGDFLAEIRTRKSQTLTYARSLGEAEDISVFDRRRRRNISAYSSERRLEARGFGYNEDDLADYDVLDYDIEASFSPQREWLDGRARVKLRVRNYALATLTLKLHETLVVQSVVAEEQGRLLVLRVKGQNSFILNLPRQLSRGEILTLRIAYGGRIPQQTPDREVVSPEQEGGQGLSDMPVVSAERRFVFSNRSFWYPQGTVTDFATARLRLAVPEPFTSVATGSPSVGNPQRLDPPAPGAPAIIVNEFVVGQPARYLSWAISRFEPVGASTVQLSPRADTTASGATEGTGGARRASDGTTEESWGVHYDGLDIQVTANPRQVNRGRPLVEQAKDILGFYAGLLDDVPYPSFTLALVDNDLPGGHSPAYFALLHQPLPTTPFVWRNDPVYFDRFPQFFLAHELAHQYWGQAVGWQSYHEQWLSEGFAQYFAALYAERRGSGAVFRDVLARMRSTVFENEDEGPIALGYRLGHIRGESRVFRAVVYNKGALVLHMLRRLVGDEAFFDALREFYRRARFTKAGTDDVRRVFEEVTGRSLERFFAGWVYDSVIPRVTWNWQIDAADPAMVTLRFDQGSQVVVDLPVTVTLNYADGSSSSAVVAVTEAQVVTRLPLAGRLVNVSVNGDSAALARFDRQ